MSFDPNDKPLVVPDDKLDRYARHRLIPWWDQARLTRAKIMVVGAGALGNEIIKNLALLGVGHLFIADSDRIERSNLTRSVLFRTTDEGQFKAKAAAKAAMEINPDVSVVDYNGNVMELGRGVFSAMDVVLGGLDNREARVFVNAACYAVGTPYIDGAIEVLRGTARVFIPGGSCYECTMSEEDYRLMGNRQSCALLSAEEIQTGHIPTTSTTASIIAAVQVQEALKLLHPREDLPVLAGRGFVYNGANHDSYVVTYPKKPDCPAHERYESIAILKQSANELTGNSLLEKARKDLDEKAILEWHRELVSGFSCNRCKRKWEVFKDLAVLTRLDALCPNCGTLAVPKLFHALYGDEEFLSRPFNEIGIPPMEIITARSGLKMIHYQLSSDKKTSIFR